VKRASAVSRRKAEAPVWVRSEQGQGRLYIISVLPTSLSVLPLSKDPCPAGNVQTGWRHKTRKTCRCVRIYFPEKALPELKDASTRHLMEAAVSFTSICVDIVLPAEGRHSSRYAGGHTGICHAESRMEYWRFRAPYRKSRFPLAEYKALIPLHRYR
jgi:hypothetical protein